MKTNGLDGRIKGGIRVASILYNVYNANLYPQKKKKPTPKQNVSRCSDIFEYNFNVELP